MMRWGDGGNDDDDDNDDFDMICCLRWLCWPRHHGGYGDGGIVDAMVMIMGQGGNDTENVFGIAV